LKIISRDNPCFFILINFKEVYLLEVVEAIEITEEEAVKFKEEIKAKEEASAKENLLPKKPLGEPLNEEDARGVIKRWADYVKNGEFTKKIMEISSDTKVPEKKLATNFIQRVLGTIGDKTEVVGNTLEDLAKSFLNILHFILKKTVEIIIKAAKFLIRLLTFNYTCIEA
jgi:hypothetical protein